MRPAIKRLGTALSACAVSIGLGTHIATFFTVVPPMWIFAAVPLVIGAGVCSRLLESTPRSVRLPSNSLEWGLLIYVMFTFVYVYKMTGGASSVGIVDGQYVAVSKDRVIRAISEHECRIIPRLWPRFMTALISMVAVSCLSAFTSAESRHTDRNA